MAHHATDVHEKQKKIFQNVQENNFNAVKYLVTSQNIDVNFTDDDGMTPLQHAAYKGDFNLCKLFLDCGADVNLTKHTSRYSSLTFGCLSGKIDVVNLLLDHGAVTSVENSINKTAAQMAAFVGNHHIVSVINNYISFETIDYFTKVQGLEAEPKLPPSMGKAVHKLSISTNVNPVRLAMYFELHPSFIENADKVCKVYRIISENMFKSNCNDLLSLKFHHLAFVVNACKMFSNDQNSKKTDSYKQDKINFTPLIKSWLKGDENGFPIGLEKFLRNDIREYEFIECSLFQQLIRTLAPVPLGEEPSAISIISDAISGQRGTDNVGICATCSEYNAEKKCSACKSVQYCDKACQKLHWFIHKNICSTLSKSEKKEEIESLNIKD